jgi:hypothetical protein
MEALLQAQQEQQHPQQSAADDDSGGSNDDNNGHDGQQQGDRTGSSGKGGGDKSLTLVRCSSIWVPSQMCTLLHDQGDHSGSVSGSTAKVCCSPVCKSPVASRRHACRHRQGFSHQMLHESARFLAHCPPYMQVNCMRVSVSPIGLLHRSGGRWPLATALMTWRHYCSRGVSSMLPQHLLTASFSHPSWPQPPHSSPLVWLWLRRSQRPAAACKPAACQGAHLKANLTFTS